MSGDNLFSVSLHTKYIICRSIRYILFVRILYLSYQTYKCDSAIKTRWVQSHLSCMHLTTKLEIFINNKPYWFCSLPLKINTPL